MKTRVPWWLQTQEVGDGARLNQMDHQRQSVAKHVPCIMYGDDNMYERVRSKTSAILPVMVGVADVGIQS